MKICLPSDGAPGKIGGGWTFLDNLQKASAGLFDIVPREADWDVALVCGATMISHDTWDALGERGPRILRIDGVPEDSRNRKTGWSRLLQFCTEADEVVYQSRFSRDTVGRMLGRSGSVIYNGVDLDVFKPDGPRLPRFGSPSVVFVLYRQDPNKRAEEAIHRFRLFKLDHPGATLTFVGQYPKALAQFGFDMCWMGEGRDWRYLGVMRERKKLAQVLRSHDMIAFPSFSDPCPNTLIEAMACGLRPIWLNEEGGQWEINSKWNEIDWGLGRMGREYLELFEGVV